MPFVLSSLFIRQLSDSALLSLSGKCRYN